MKNFNQQVLHWVATAAWDCADEDFVKEHANAEFIMELIKRYEHLSKLVELNEHMKAFINNKVEIDPDVASILSSDLEDNLLETILEN